MLQWRGSGFLEDIGPEFFHVNGGSWTWADRGLASIEISRMGKCPRLCRVGDWLIMSRETNEYFDDLEYLPEYGKP